MANLPRQCLVMFLGLCCFVLHSLVVRGEEFADDDYSSPMQLLKPGEGHDRLELSALALEKLAAISRPVSLVAVVGPYHGGKSFLLNILMGSSHGFDVGAKPEPETRGIWIRFVPMDLMKGVDGSQIVLLDTEGLYGEGATRSYDARVFALATLLSSHLIYNTLRTIGDAQSVSSLADLAKQAQVFNLQNWLHTADSISDPSISSTPAVDPFLLLKTLHFPSLTWVVQGFDMDLQASETPMDHLQRYFAAHAHSGDRTLDTLFTQGITCHTMRTPTDLNLLREVVGGAGLAADEELYPYLHPSYLSDVENLRAAVIGNLTAKGGFNGKTLSEILPLLVHFVNEDFPLNSERKLRDVLVDVVVDGAFSGGAQYFQIYMKSLPDKSKVLSARKGKEVNVVQAQLDLAEGGDRLSSLAASAFTPEELEQLLASAESKAIDYCKKRCVGVPVGRSAITCEAQLGVKVSRMKPRYREENEQRVKEVLVLLGQGLRAAAEKEVDGLALPMRNSDIQTKCNQAIKDALQRYEALVGPHQGGRLYNEARAQMQSDIQIRCDRVSRKNIDKIAMILGQGKVSFSNAYDEVLMSQSMTENQPSPVHSELKKPISLRKLLEINKAAVVVARVAFETTSKENGLSWLGAGDEQYDLYQFKCEQWANKRFADLQAQNEADLLAYCQKQATSCAAQYREEISKISPFPDNDEILTSKADKLAKDLMEEYGSSVKEFVPSSLVEEKRKDLVLSIQESRIHLLRKNTHLMTAFCYDPLMDAYKELHMQDCDRTYHNVWKTKTFWSRKCLWPGPQFTFGFKHAAYAAARKHLDKAQTSTAKGIILSPTTRNKVIQSWIEHDLAAHANVVFTNFSIITASVLACISGVVWLLGGLRQQRTPQVPTYGPRKSYYDRGNNGAKGEDTGGVRNRQRY